MFTLSCFLLRSADILQKGCFLRFTSDYFNTSIIIVSSGSAVQSLCAVVYLCGFDTSVV